MTNLTPRTAAIAEAVLDLFTAIDATPQEGELVLAYLLGLSRGNRGAAIFGPDMLPIADTITTAWKFAATHGDG